MRVRKKLEDSANWLKSRPAVKNAVLLYHRVDRKDQDHFNLCVTPENFEQQMSILAERRTVIPLQEMVTKHQEGNMVPGEISITFDDGYLDVIQIALPILQKHNLPATLFVTTGSLGEPFWWDKLAAIIHQPASLPESINFDSSCGDGHVLPAGRRQRISIFNSLYQWLRVEPPEHRDRVIDNFHEALCPNLELHVQRAATDDELSAAAESSLFTLEAHTVTHPRLASLTYEEQLEEVSTSIEHVSRLRGSETTSFSYPFGLKNRDYHEETVEAVKATGLRHAFAADLGVITPHSPAMALPRIWAHDYSGERFLRQIKLWLGH